MISAADRTTHVKILAIALAASVAVLLVGLTARSPAVGAGTQAGGPAMKVGKPVALSRNDLTVIR